MEVRGHGRVEGQAGVGQRKLRVAAGRHGLPLLGGGVADDVAHPAAAVLPAVLEEDEPVAGVPEEDEPGPG